MNKYATILIDGSNAIHRAAHVARPLSTVIDDVEVPIGAVYQTIRMILHEVDRTGARRVFVAWEGDRDGASWRRDLFPGYKADRDPNRHCGDLQRQEAILREALSDLGWSQVWSPGFEADDTLATLADRLVRNRLAGPLALWPVAIVTGDRDLHQCVTDRVHVVNGPDTWTPEKVREKWGVAPSRVPEVKAISGDKSDGIPGVKGIGDKGALEILTRWGSLEEAIAGATSARDAGDKSATLRKFTDGAADARLFRRLTTVRQDAPLEFAPRRKIAPRIVFERFAFASLCAPSWLRIADRLANG